ncbi:MAG: hypothetical protein VXW65_02195 [Pseudomonadota bacterium]|nr:hypothetical protein [Pseudomonadota bacterium]
MIIPPIPPIIATLQGQSRQQALRILQRQVKGKLQVIAGLDHLDDSRRDWLPQLQLSLRYDLNDCVQQINLNAVVAQIDLYQSTQYLKPQDLLAYYRANRLPFLNLGNVIHSISEGVSFCFDRQQLHHIVWTPPSSFCATASR